MTSGTRSPAPLRSRPYRRFNPRLPRGRRPLRSRPFPFPFRFVSFQPTPSGGGKATAPALRARRHPERARSQPEARTARAPVRWRVSWRAHRPAYQPTPRYAPDGAQNAPGAARSPQRARSRADASQKPAPRAPRLRRVSWRAHRRTFTPTDTVRAGASRRFNPRLPGGRRPRQNQPEALPRARRLVARVVARAPTSIPDRDSVTRRRFAPDAARNAPGASRKRLPRATSLQHDHRSGPDSTATPGHCATATARAPVAPDDAGAQRRSSVAVAPPGHIVCTQVSCESASPFSFTSTQADTDAARPAFTP